MRLILNIVLILLILFLGYLMVNSIKEPIVFNKEKEKRESAVQAKLEKVRSAQEIYRAIHGKFANNFDDLSNSLLNDSIPVFKVYGDPDDPNNQEKIRVDTLYFSAKDSIDAMGIDPTNLKFVPYGTDNLEFSIQADTLTYQKTIVNVVEVGVPRRDFMGKYADERFKQYDSSYDPNEMLKFGDMTKPNLSGNW